MREQEIKTLLDRLLPMTLIGTLQERSQITVVEIMLRQILIKGTNSISYEDISERFQETNYEHFRLGELFNTLIEKQIVQPDSMNDLPFIFTVHYRLHDVSNLIQEKKEQESTAAFQRYFIKSEKAIKQQDDLSAIHKSLLKYLLTQLQIGNEEFIALPTILEQMQTENPAASADQVRFALKQLVHQWGIECHMVENKEATYRFLNTFCRCNICDDILLPTEYFTCAACEQSEMDDAQQLVETHNIMVNFLLSSGMPLDYIYDYLPAVPYETIQEVTQKLKSFQEYQVCEECRQPMERSFFKTEFVIDDEDISLHVDICCQDCFEKNNHL